MTDTAATTSDTYVATLPPRGRVQRFVWPNVGGFVALALLPLVFFTDIPFAGWAIAATMWLINRIGHAIVLSLVNGLPKTMAVGAAGFGMMLRVWTIAFFLFFVGAELHAGEMTIGMGRPDLAVPAMLLFMVIFTFDVALRSVAELRRYKTGGDQAPSEETPA